MNFQGMNIRYVLETMTELAALKTNLKDNTIKAENIEKIEFIGERTAPSKPTI